MVGSAEAVFGKLCPEDSAVVSITAHVVRITIKGIVCHETLTQARPGNSGDETDTDTDHTEQYV